MLSNRSLRRLLVAAILACAASASAAQSTAHLPRADDFAMLAKEARARRVPIMIAFVQESCAYCAIAKRDYLVPMHLDAKLRDRVIIREVDIDRRAKLRDFDGRAASPAEFSRRYLVRRVPTVVVVGEGGELLAAPVVGLLLEDFYGLYLEQAVEAGLIKLRTARGQRRAGVISR
jgi:thioredoxin-related protein